MPVVKKTISIAPEIDRCIRNLWAELVVRGYDVGYSTALNILIAMGMYQILTDAGAKEYAERFLQKVFELLGDIKVSESMDKALKWVMDIVLQIVKSVSDVRVGLLHTNNRRQ
jgi:hypothetical protein